MYDITLVTLGERLKVTRESLGLSQEEIANIINSKQNAISNIERGKGGSITVLLKLLNLYSKHIYIDFIFKEKFFLVSTNENEEANKSEINSIIVKIIKDSESQLKEELEGCSKQLSKNLEVALSLLKG